MTVNITETILDDLCSRFLVNLPREELDDPVRVCFQIELAHWFYTDFYKTDKADNPPRCGLRDFIRIIFNYLPNLKKYASSVDSIIDQWRKYKSAVPTYGAMLLDEQLDHVLLVQGFYATSRWGFPKGKVNEEEPPHLCAIREVREETGFDSSALLNPTVYIERLVSDTNVRLYIVAGAPKSFAFHPETRNEIRNIKWFPVEDLPTDKYDNSKNALGVYANNFYGVIPFVNGLKEWIRIKKGLPPTMTTTNEMTKKFFRSYSPNQQQNLIRSAGSFGKGNGANHGRGNRQRTQSLSAPLAVENGTDYNCHPQIPSTNGYVRSTHHGSNNAQNVTTPKFPKYHQNQQQYKKQKNSAKTKLFTDDIGEGSMIEKCIAEHVNGVENETRGVEAIHLAQVWQNFKIDWNRILKDL